MPADRLDESVAARALLLLTLGSVLVLPFTFLVFGVGLPTAHALLMRCARVRWPFWYVVELQQGALVRGHNRSTCTPHAVEAQG